MRLTALTGTLPNCGGMRRRTIYFWPAADWLAFRGMAMWPVVALFLHVDRVAEGRPWGSVTLLDYQAVAKDIATFSPLPQAQRERHIKLLVKRYTQRPGLCSMLDMIHYLKTGKEVKPRWT